MAKHLPPPKNKHLSQSPSKHGLPKTESKERDILNERDFSLRPLLACLASSALLILLRVFTPEGWLKTLLYILPLLAVSAGVLLRLAETLMSGDFYEEDVVILLAALAAFCIGRFAEASVVMILYRVGEIFSDYAVARCRGRLEGMVSSRSKNANVLRDGRVLTVKTETVTPGEILLVSPGEMIPLDGVIEEGLSSVDTSLISGERKHMNVSPGSTVLAGCRNVSRDIKLMVIRGFEDSAYTRIVDNLADKGKRKARQELYASRFAGIYTPAAVLLALILSILPPIFNGLWKEWIERGVIILILSCPCALTVSVPLSYLSALIRSSAAGIHIRDKRVVEDISRAESFVFDKTGTVTEGRYAVAGIYPEGVSEAELLRAASEAERYSKHPVGRSIRQLYKNREPGEEENIEIEEIHGKGVCAVIERHRILVGNASLLEDNGIRYNVPSRPGAAIHVAVDGVYWGFILVIDRVKNGAYDALEAMRRQGVRNMVLLTGDVRSVSRTLASSLNFDMVKAELLPESKVAAVEYLMATKGERSALGFVGDAENDREALSRADVGIALGAISSELPFDNAEVVIMSGSLSKLPAMLEIAGRCTRAVWLNFLVVILTKLVLLILGSIGILPIIAVAALDTAALIFSMLNTMSILKENKKEDER